MVIDTGTWAKLILFWLFHLNEVNILLGPFANQKFYIIPAYDLTNKCSFHTLFGIIGSGRPIPILQYQSQKGVQRKFREEWPLFGRCVTNDNVGRRGIKYE